MKVLITGGAGFIGSHVIEELLEYEFQVVSVDNYVTGFKENLCEGVKKYEMDLNDPKFESIFIEEQPDYVIHLAAQASVMVSMNDPYFDFLTNTVGTINVMLLSKKYNVRKFLFASSAAVYGEPEYLPIDENHSINSQSFYALSKHSAENYIKHYSVFNGLDSCILRFSNVYGPRQNEMGEAGVISIFINRLLADKEVSIYDGSQTRDFIYVKDVASACRLALMSEAKGVFNISSCSETGIEELYNKITELTGINTIPLYEPRRLGEIVQSILDNRRAINEFDWHVQYSLQEGLNETTRFYTNKRLSVNVEK
ncbi:NAD-dependent epimerase/dehydratase family protein [Sporosarcina sp. FA9]|uniref:NAD-dependent epimerase/dehydratase family protein n=1 Tax=Sporosarcina sp. FA9 TaxID=3413030 RepID=UPI003F657465